MKSFNTTIIVPNIVKWSISPAVVFFSIKSETNYVLSQIEKHHFFWKDDWLKSVEKNIQYIA